MDRSMHARGAEQLLSTTTRSCAACISRRRRECTANNLTQYCTTAVEVARGREGAYP
jgi:hypothetical protein